MRWSRCWSGDRHTGLRSETQHGKILYDRSLSVISGPDHARVDAASGPPASDVGGRAALIALSKCEAQNGTAAAVCAARIRAVAIHTIELDHWIAGRT